MSNKLYYSDEAMKIDLHSIIQEITVVDSFKLDVVIGPGRGAYVPGVMLSHYFDVPFEGFLWQTRDLGMETDEDALKAIVENWKGKNILLVDDINDTGKTLAGISRIVHENAAESTVWDIRGLICCMSRTMAIALYCCCHIPHLVVHQDALIFFYHHTL